MARTNKPKTYTRKTTHEGATATRISAEQELERTVMATMLFEDTFYENGVSVADRIKDLVHRCDWFAVGNLAMKARHQMKLRHVPLLLARELARYKNIPECERSFVGDVIGDVIERPDELAEFLSLYWKEGRQPLSAQAKKGLAYAFTKFDEHQLAKYNRDNAIKLRDVLFLCHAKPEDKEQERVFKRLVDGTLATPDTWEVELSKGKGEDKKGSWERLLRERKLGGLALLRNLRNFREANVDQLLVRAAIADMKTERVLPFRFLAAARYAPELEDVLEHAMFKSLEGTEMLPGRTVLLVDVSGSMVGTPVSKKSEMDRFDAACALAMLLREITQEGAVFAFSTSITQIPPRRGFGLRDAIKNSPGYNGGTQLGEAVRFINANQERIQHDRIIVVTDEQSADRVPDPTCKNAYMINVGTYKNGVGYGKWTHIDGWSEAIVNYIRAFEKLG